jgi:NADPH2:quinone reductase
MRCVEIREPGAPDVLRVAERPDPTPSEGEVLIDVMGAGVNRPDVLQRQGAYPPPAGASDVPGLEVSGHIVAVGLGVDPARVGQAVCALVTGGGYATRCVAADPLALPVPAGLDLESAAAVPEAAFTVWDNLFTRGRLAPGESVLVHGGTSGIGTTAIQLAVARGVTVLATAGTDEKCQTCRRLGAAVAINYRSADFVTQVLAATGGKGVDVVLDIVGGPYVARNLAVLATEGRLVQIGLMAGDPTAAVDLRRVLGRRLTLMGSTLRPRSVSEKARIASALVADVWPLVAAGRVRPLIHATFPLEEAAAAHRLMESSEHVGKILLRTR